MLFGNAANVKSPCRDCNARCAGCHGNCQSYANYRAEIDNNKAIRIAKYNECQDVLKAMNGMTKARVYGGV